MTANPLLAATRSRPWSMPLARVGRGFHLVADIESGSRDVMDARMHDGRHLWELLAELVDELGATVAMRRPGSPTSGRSPAPRRPSISGACAS
jgi:hypothetical protein